MEVKFKSGAYLMDVSCIRSFKKSYDIFTYGEFWGTVPIEDILEIRKTAFYLLPKDLRYLNCN